MERNCLNELIKMMAVCGKMEETWDEEPSDDTLAEAIKFMLERSLFFFPEIVKDRTEEMLNEIHGTEPELYVRASKKNNIQKDDKGCYYYDYYKTIKIKCRIDKDGNKEVRKVIKRKTRYQISQGEGNTIKFINISHIWGNASNPVFYGSMEYCSYTILV